MDSIILAGGYARRMSPTTNEIPKQLLPVAGRPLLDYIIDSLNEFYSKDVEGTCYLSVNKKYQVDFENFIKNTHHVMPLELIVEDQECEEKKLGSICALGQIADKIDTSYGKGTMVIGGDNLFSLDIYEMFNYYKQHPERSIAALYDIKDKDKAKLYGTAVLDTKYTDHPWGNQITRFEEKPKNPESTLVSTAIYIFRATDLARITDYMSEGNNADTIGSYIDWLIKNEERTGFRDWAWHTLGVNGFVFDGYWFDIGSNESLEQANRLLRKTYSKKILKQEEVCV